MLLCCLQLVECIGDLYEMPFLMCDQESESVTQLEFLSIY